MPPSALTAHKYAHGSDTFEIIVLLLLFKKYIDWKNVTKQKSAIKIQ